jgi:uncharacterized protein
MSENSEPELLQRRIKAALERRFGDKLAGVYLFGSRARGGHRPDSDLDVAVVLKRVSQPLSAIDQELLDLTYPLEIEQGVHIQAWALPAESMTNGGLETAQLGTLRARLAAAVQREGIAL